MRYTRLLLLMRLARPARTLPGPHSADSVMPSETSALTVSVQRTGQYSWRTKAFFDFVGIIVRGNIGVMNNADLRLFDGDVFQCFGKFFRCRLHEAAM